MKNHNAIYEFITNPSNEEYIDIDSFGNARFCAEIKYLYDGKDIRSTSNIKITRNGYYDGNISIEENEDLNANFLHLDLSVDFQEYSYDLKDNTFTISGESPKLNGNYTVVLSINKKR